MSISRPPGAAMKPASQDVEPGLRDYCAARYSPDRHTMQSMNRLRE
jgi:hypothetical protein